MLGLWPVGFEVEALSYGVEREASGARDVPICACARHPADSYIA
ncbi:MAG: hypothetical protein WAU77_10685 [Solirubrobacteraceae bacterium]